MKDFWASIANAFSGENGPLYFAITAIAGLTMGWKFMANNYCAEWNGGKIQPQSMDIKPENIPYEEIATTEPDE